MGCVVRGVANGSVVRRVALRLSAIGRVICVAALSAISLSMLSVTEVELEARSAALIDWWWSSLRFFPFSDILGATGAAKTVFELQEAKTGKLTASGVFLLEIN